MDGEWTITITGKGKHHSGKPKDADQVALDFVQKLIACDQTVRAATFAHQGSDNLCTLVKPAT